MEISISQWKRDEGDDERITFNGGFVVRHREERATVIVLTRGAREVEGRVWGVRR